MAQITLRVPDDLLDEIDNATDSETSRSEWLRDAARDRLKDDDLRDRLDQMEKRIGRLERETNRPIWKRILD